MFHNTASLHKRYQSSQPVSFPFILQTRLARLWFPTTNFITVKPFLNPAWTRQTCANDSAEKHYSSSALQQMKSYCIGPESDGSRLSTVCAFPFCKQISPIFEAAARNGAVVGRRLRESISFIASVLRRIFCPGEEEVLKIPPQGFLETIKLQWTQFSPWSRSGSSSLQTRHTVPWNISRCKSINCPDIAHGSRMRNISAAQDVFTHQYSIRSLGVKLK